MLWCLMRITVWCSLTIALESYAFRFTVEVCSASQHVTSSASSARNTSKEEHDIEPGSSPGRATHLLLICLHLSARGGRKGCWVSCS